MKKVEAIVQTSKLEAIRSLLGRIGVDGMTVSDVRSFGDDEGHLEVYKAEEHQVFLVPRVRVEIIVEDGRTPALIEELMRVVRTGKLSDGRIFVMPVDDAIRIRTSERGREAL